MSATPPQSAEDFNIVEAVITTDRSPVVINIANIIAEVNIYESIYNQYLTGSVLLVDDQDIQAMVGFEGTERLKLSFEVPGNLPGTKRITKNFVIVNIKKTHKYNDYTEILLLTIIEEHAFRSSVQLISKSYTGRGEEIIGSLLLDNLNKTIDDAATRGFSTFKTSYQEPFRFITPYISPLDAVKTILRKITTDNGMPYYCYSTFSSDNMVIADLETIIQREPSQKNPFIFSQSIANSSEVFTPYSIQSYELSNNDDTLLLSQLGAIGSIHSVLNISNGQKQLEHVDINNVFRGLVDAEIIPRDQNKLLLDNSFIVDPTKNPERILANYDSRYFHQIAGSTYPTWNSRNAAKNWTEEKDPYSYKMRIYRYAIEQFLHKNTANIVLPGILFLTGRPEYDTGNQINIQILKNSPDQGNNTDPKRSGRYIIISKRHIFNKTTQSHTVSIECGRLSSSNSV